MNVFFSDLFQKNKISHGFFTKCPAGNDNALLNVAFGRADSEEVVRNNRQIVSKYFGEQTRLFMTNQGHTNKVRFIEDRAEWDASSTGPQIYDALVTRAPGCALGIYTADCVPILLADPTVPIIGIAHGGWKGLHQKILEKTLQVMRQHGAQNHSIHAAIGPCIQRDSYTVGEEFRDYFPEDLDCFWEKENELHLDLPKIAEHQLVRLGVSFIDNLQMDTYANEAFFYSYRRANERDEALEGAQASVIAL